MRNRSLLVGIVLFGLLATPFAFAQNTIATPVVAELQAVIQQLQNQIRSLQEQLSALGQELAVVKTELALTRTLQRGDTGEEVRKLQEALAQDPEVYPEGLTTGYFGIFTERAVKRFQEKHRQDILAPLGLAEGTGIVGEMTRQKLNITPIPAVPAQPAIPAQPTPGEGVPAVPATPAIPAIPAQPGTPTSTPDTATPTPSPTPTPTPEPTPSPSPTPTQEPIPPPSPTPSPTSPTSACVGGSERIPGLPNCLMPENLAGTGWNEVDNVTGKVLNTAVCSVAVCGRNGEWRTWPSNKLLNGRYYPNGYPENSTYIQTPLDHANWGRYFTNGVWETYDGKIFQPGSVSPDPSVTSTTDDSASASSTDASATSTDDSSATSTDTSATSTDSVLAPPLGAMSQMANILEATRQLLNQMLELLR